MAQGKPDAVRRLRHDGVPAALRPIILRATRYTKDQRYPNARTMRLDGRVVKSCTEQGYRYTIMDATNLLNRDLTEGRLAP